jgi:hypothetical protein
MNCSAVLLAIAAMGLLLLPPPPAGAQPAAANPAGPSETVIVTAPRLAPETLKAVVHDYVKTYAMVASPFNNAIARWKRDICPRTDGLSQDRLDLFVTQRIRQVAGLAGAPVAATPCKPNLDIVFTDQPERALDLVRAQDPARLGYHGAAPARANFDHAVQAWYVTQTVDIAGHATADEEPLGTLSLPTGQPGRGIIIMNPAGDFGGVPTRTRVGSLLKTGYRSEFTNILIIADSRKTGLLQLGAVADYIAMLALAQAGAFEVCQNLPSIINLTAPDCDAGRKTAGITDGDLAYLRGVYRTDPTMPFLVQQSDIASGMTAALGGH